MKVVYAILLTTAILAISGCKDGAIPAPPAEDQTITILQIPGVVAPKRSALPTTTAIDTAQYTGTIAWTGNPAVFAPNTVYTATIALTAKTGWKLKGVAANTFTVAGATVEHEADTGIITAVFPETGNPIVIGANIQEFNDTFCNLVLKGEMDRYKTIKTSQSTLLIQCRPRPRSKTKSIHL